MALSLLTDNPIQRRVRALLRRMSLAQKIGQMTQADQQTCTPQQVRQYHLGAILSSAGSCPGDNRCADWVALNDEYWHASMSADNGRIPIPVLYGLDAVHGNNNVRGATIFPHNIGLGAADDTELLKRVCQITAKEVLATGVDWVFSPNLAVAQNFQWGRTYESFSQQTERVSRFAPVMVASLQQGFNEQGVLSCLKHWVGDGATLHGIDQGNTHLSWQQLQQQHIAPFMAAMKSGAWSVMASLSSWNGEKCHANEFLLNKVLKQQLGFKGFVVSDFQGIDYLADDFYLAVEKGVNAGIDMFMVPENWQLFIEYLHRHVEMGTVSMQRIDNAVSRILTAKLVSGQFEKPRPAKRKWSNDASFGCAVHRQVAREAVRKSLVLLKNESNLLPLSKHSRVLVAGKNADNRGFQCGGFTLEWQGVDGNELIEGGTSIWEGIQQQVPHAQLSAKLDGSEADAQLHDAAIVVIGEKPYAEGLGDIRHDDSCIMQTGSEMEGQLNIQLPFGSSLQLSDLYPQDLQTIQTIRDAGVPVICVLISGRPLVVNDELALSDAFVAAWLPGSEGQGVSDVLFGDFDFNGNLPFNWPSNLEQCANVHALASEPLYPVGYGLRYR